MSDEELKTLFDAMRGENTAAHEETRRQVEATAVETRRQVETTAVETRRYFDVVGEGMRSDIRLLSEGMTAMDGKFERRFESVESKIDQTALEETVTNLQTRLERLESSTH